MSTVYLKIKLKSLAAEARIIRHEQAKHRNKGRGGPTEVWWGLRDHRRGIVRSEARFSLLAYGFLRGRSYAAMEGEPRPGINWKRVEEMVRKYGTDDIRDRMQRFEAWKDEATAKPVQVQAATGISADLT